MKCKVCGQEYPSEYYFNEEGVCKECSKEFHPDESESFTCSDCGADVSIDDKVCPKCGADLSEIEEEGQPPSSHVETKYPALRIIAGILKALAILIGIAAIIGLLYGLSQLDKGYLAKASGIRAIISSLATGITVLILLAFSEIIKLFIDLEGNSRKQISILNQILDKKQNI